MTPQTIHALLVAEGEAQALPTHYKNDLLKHDLDHLMEFKSEHFLWVLRECGTHLITLDQSPTEKLKSETRAYGRAIAKTFGDACKWYLYQGEKLKPITRERALDIINSY